jgi:hypothetical protein
MTLCVPAPPIGQLRPRRPCRPTRLDCSGRAPAHSARVGRSLDLRPSAPRRRLREGVPAAWLAVATCSGSPVSRHRAGTRRMSYLGRAGAARCTCRWSAACHARRCSAGARRGPACGARRRSRPGRPPRLHHAAPDLLAPQLKIGLHCLGHEIVLGNPQEVRGMRDELVCRGIDLQRAPDAWMMSQRESTSTVICSRVWTCGIYD